MKVEIDILLATYNGAAYLAAQIRSLQNQTFTAWRLIVHDDGSTDDTLAIVKDFAQKDKRIVLVEDGVCFGNPAGNFLHLLKYSESPFLIFCDQDDIWLENKLEILYNAIIVRNNTIAQAVYCNSYVYAPAFGHIHGTAVLCRPKSLKDAFFMNGGVQGCGILFNACLREICKDTPDYVCMHDHLLTLAALAFGEFTYIDMSLMLYRRYDRTVTGETDGSFYERLFGFFKGGKSVLCKKHFRAIKSFYAHYQAMLPVEHKQLFERLFRYEGRSRIINACNIVCDGFNMYGSKTILFVKLLVRPLVNN